ncbi:MAG: cation-translocating P-type ATPase [Chlamydiales bacterium]|nr:cation-translocating P-type ATPase [Chlamydiales bacterium]
MTKPSPYFFNEFIESGLEESISPFLTLKSKRWGRHLPLKASITAAFFLGASFVFYQIDSFAIAYLLLTFVYFLAGIPSLINSIEDLSNLIVNIDVLMTLAAFLSILIGSGMEGGLLLVLFSLSGSIEETVTAKAKSALSNLRELAPPQAFVVAEDGTIFERSVKDILVGTKILVKSGEVVPLDGTVMEGISSVNLVHLTGENLPVLKQVGDNVPAGARNLEGSLVITITHTSTESTLARLITLITQAQEARPTLQRWIDKLSHGYAITIILLSIFFAGLLPLFFSIPFLGVEGSIYRALTFLIAASPCALVIAIPIGYLSAISACAKKGILLKGGIILDALASCKMIAFDKTGTLTTGELSLSHIKPLQNYSEADLQNALRIALSLERNAVHPVAKAVCNYVQEKKLTPLPISEYKSIPGYGLEGTVNLHGKLLAVYIGKAEHILKSLNNASKLVLEEENMRCKKEGNLLAVLKINDDLILLQFKDTPRARIKELIQTLKTKFSLRLVMLTGDHKASALAVAKELNIDEVHSELLPEEKLSLVSKYSQDSNLAMIGDGINDAPALARATVGISMGKVGSTTAIDASDIVLLHDNIELLDFLIAKSHATKRIILENVCVAFAAILFASIPALFGIVPLWLAVILHEGGTVLVGLNSLRLLKS